MPRFAFQVQCGQFTEFAAGEDVLNDQEAARKAAPGICADLAKDVVAGLTEYLQGRLAVPNENGQPIFRLRLRIDTLEPAS